VSRNAIETITDKETAEMTTYHQFLIVLGVAAALGVTAGTASAVGHPCNGPFCNQAAYPKHRHTLLAFGGGHQPLPTYQAAPWYLYWPYDAHFQTPAPVFAAYAPPPVYPLPYNPYNPGFAYPGAYWSTSGHPVPGCGGTGWPPIPTPQR
jgi:hypothetical protein